MKKSLILLLIAMLILTFASCGVQTASEAETSLNGKWQRQDNYAADTYLYIEGEEAVFDFDGMTYTGTVGEDTILLNDDSIYDYKLVSGLLVLTLDPDKNDNIDEEVIDTYERVDE